MIDRNKHFPVYHFGGHWSIGHWPKLEAVVRWIRSLILFNSPAAILRAWLVLQSKGTYPSSYGQWPIFVSHLPDGDGLDEAICLYDLAPNQHGELPDGQNIEHKTIQLTVRGQSALSVSGKIADLCGILDTVKNEILAIGVNSYEIATANFVFSTKLFQDGQRRFMSSSGYYLSLYRRVPI